MVRGSKRDKSEFRKKSSRGENCLLAPLVNDSFLARAGMVAEEQGQPGIRGGVAKLKGRESLSPPSISDYAEILQKQACSNRQLFRASTVAGDIVGSSVPARNRGQQLRISPSPPFKKVMVDNSISC
jgi:hypothetical protein